MEANRPRRAGARVCCTHNKRVTKDSRVYVRASDDDQRVFREVAESLGQSNMSAAIRMVMREKHRQLGLDQPARTRRAKEKR